VNWFYESCINKSVYFFADKNFLKKTYKFLTQSIISNSISAELAKKAAVAAFRYFANEETIASLLFAFPEGKEKAEEVCEKIEANRLLLITESLYFRKAFTAGYRESKGEMIVLSHDPKIFALVLDFLEERRDLQGF